MFEMIEVTDSHMACDGGHGPLGHPRIYLQIDHLADRITCPYCSRTYVLKDSKLGNVA